jgi:hypothetical protein
MRKVIIGTILLYIFCCILYESGYKKTSDKDYFIDNIPPSMDTLTFDDSLELLPQDTTQYKGNWVDPQ